MELVGETYSETQTYAQVAPLYSPLSADLLRLPSSTRLLQLT